jgi:hypothetical protein
MAPSNASSSRMGSCGAGRRPRVNVVLRDADAQIDVA